MGMRLCVKEKETGNMIFYGTKYIGYKDIFEVSLEWVPTNTIP